MTQPKITLKINKKVLRPTYKKLKKILRDSSLENETKIYLRVVYGKKKLGTGKVEVIDNEMIGTAQELLMGAEAFMDKDLWLVA